MRGSGFGLGFDASLDYIIVFAASDQPWGFAFQSCGVVGRKWRWRRARTDGRWTGRRFEVGDRGLIGHQTSHPLVRTSEYNVRSHRRELSRCSLLCAQVGRSAPQPRPEDAPAAPHSPPGGPDRRNWLVCVSRESGRGPRPGRLDQVGEVNEHRVVNYYPPLHPPSHNSTTWEEDRRRLERVSWEMA